MKYNEGEIEKAMNMVSERSGMEIDLEEFEEAVYVDSIEKGNTLTMNSEGILDKNSKKIKIIKSGFKEYSGDCEEIFIAVLDGRIDGVLTLSEASLKMSKGKSKDISEMYSKADISNLDEEEINDATINKKALDEIRDAERDKRKTEEDRLERERIKKVAIEEAKKEKLKKEKLKKEKLKKEKLKKEKLEKEKLEKEKLKKEKLKKEKLEKEKIEKEKLEKERIEKEVEGLKNYSFGYKSSLDIFRESIRGRVIDKEEWSSKCRLDSYIYNMAKLCRLDRNAKSRVVNEKGNIAIYNSGLINKSLEDIYIIDSSYGKPEIDINEFRILNRRKELEECGFKEAELRVLPDRVKVEGEEGFAFDRSVTIDSFDTLYAQSYHIIGRKDRLGIESDVSIEEISRMIKNAIESALKIYKYDNQYIVPMYYIEDSKVEWLVPFYINNKIYDKPEGVIIVKKSYGGYTVGTALTLDMARNNARLLGKINAKWLR